MQGNQGMLPGHAKTHQNRYKASIRGGQKSWFCIQGDQRVTLLRFLILDIGFLLVTTYF